MGAKGHVQRDAIRCNKTFTPEVWFDMLLLLVGRYGAIG